jgi:hypothetical protein
MMQAAYDLAILLNPWVQILIGVAVIAGLIADHGGTRRIGLVVAAVTLFFTLAPMSPQWPEQRMIWLTAINLLAAVPLLVHPVTSRQQGIAASYLGLGLMHCIFAVLSVGDPLAVTANWLASRLVDAVQAGLLLWWSWPNARERLSGLYHKGASSVLHRDLPKVSGTPPFRAPD